MSNTMLSPQGASINGTPAETPEERLLRLEAENARMKELVIKLTSLAQRGENDRKSLEGMEKSLNFYRRMKAREKMEEDLSRIKRLDPSIRSIDELGSDYLALIRNGIDGAAAFLALRGQRDLDIPKAPPIIGGINDRTAESREYFTGSELDRLTDKDLDDPRVLEKAIKSLKRL